jgi:hypothetical protein
MVKNARYLGVERFGNPYYLPSMITFLLKALLASALGVAILYAL